MARRPLKVTGFTRFVIVMLFIAPLAYIGASYYNGEDGIQNIKDLLRIGDRTEQAEPSSSDGDAVPVNQRPANNGSLEAENKKLKEELTTKNTRIDELGLEVEQLKRRLESLEKVLEESKK